MRRSIATNSLARLASDVAFLFFSFLSGVITARVLTPEGKGAYAALLSLITLLGSVSTLGLGDAAVVLAGHGRVSLSRVAKGISGPVLAASIAGSVFLVMIAEWQLAGREGLGKAIFVAAVATPAAATLHAFTFIANARERIIETSVIRGLTQFILFVGTVLLVWLWRLHITGAVAAVAIALIAGNAATFALLQRMGIGAAVGWDQAFLTTGLRLGLIVQVGHTLLALASRVDVLIVYSLSGAADAGRYSVALTVGQLVTFCGLAISFALFPRLAAIEEQLRLPLVARASRVAVAASLVAAAVLVVGIPFALPATFGRAYMSSVGPALILLVGGIIWAQQHLLSRASTAAGRPIVQVRAFGATLVVMIALDFVLIPVWGNAGAALASVAGPLTGLGVCAASYRQAMRRHSLCVRDFLPKSADFRDLWIFLASFRRHLVRM